MKTAFVALLALLPLAFANPVPSPAMLVARADPTVTQILQFALTLEHLEDAFYRRGLAQYNEAAFTKSGLPSWSRGRFEQIGQHESTHVAFLTAALGSAAPQPCTYSFPYTDPKSFAILSAILEGVGTSAYLGAAQYLTSNPTVLEAAGAILTTEARHTAWVAGAVLSGAPWSGAFDTALSGNDVYSLASQFITSCPSSNPTLPFTAFPKLTVNGGKTAEFKAGQHVTLSYSSPSGTTSGTKYLALRTGLTTEFAKITNNQVTLPNGLQGVAYGVVTTAGPGSNVTDANTIAGPAVFYVPFNSQASNP